MAGYRPLEPQWHRDPLNRHEYRFWDGTAWTERVADNGIEGTDSVPMTGAPQPAFRQPEVSEPTVEPSPAPRPSEPGASVQRTAPVDRDAEDAVASDGRASSPAGGPFNFDDAELDHAPPESVDLDRLNGDGKKSGLLVGAVALIAVILLGGFFLFRGNDGDTEPVADGQSSPIAGDGDQDDGAASASGFPSAAEQGVIDRLPGGFQCQRAAGEDFVDSAEGTVDCSANQTPPVQIHASAFTDRAMSDSYLDQLVADSSAEYVPDSDCAAANTGLWVGGDFSGRVLCSATDGVATLAWTVGAEPIVNVASSDDAATLADWWQTAAVPGPVRILQPFPTAREAAALDLVPAELAATCTRFIGRPTDGAIGSLECRPVAVADATDTVDTADVDVVYLDVFEEEYDIDAFFHAFDLPRSDKGGCRVGVPGNNSYSVAEESVGRVACYVRDGRTWLHWYDSRTQLVGQANFTDADVVEPYEWWSANAVVGATEDRTLDRAERRVFQAVPEAIAESCVAEPVNAENDRWSARLQCSPDDEGILSVTYFAFQTPRRITNEFNTRRGEIEADSGSCVAGGVPSEGAWESGERSGREICQVRQGVAEIFSADIADKIAFLVAGENDDIDRLASWVAQNR